ncbi:putative signal transduction protein with CBS and DRTGG domains [Thermoanaerobacter mathranii subsp. mathranii str. A3]|uniref:Signal transduction protein with CBS and DRTGG domains n=2 Tax=Thermoanaerobacter TaxID=1754 RepID=D3T3T2_THEIA|nr:MULTISPECIES: DRTGG domain-containing protein [Thermoanaerobacter]ADD02884.1 putative signal transduction protein with CBS and DRTGG domains [Thermoanaerobacter italicus Ab9]ADH61330.1 putative signal transduction protein with CBS and DRTGG domains [Thermoanaerobacter mathranii subsp. mathranii str. A3]
MKKNEIVLEYIKNLPEGTKISVRSLAQTLHISEGTAYKAIKDAENLMLVTTIPRVGTIRRKQKEPFFDRLTYEVITEVVEGTVLGGHGGMGMELHKFLIGAMTIEEMVKYISPGDLVILGNREDAQEAALKAGAAVMITGGFDTLSHIKELADKLSLPLISTSYDTFTVATLINKAINESMTRKKILYVSDVMTYNPIYMMPQQTVKDWKKLYTETKHTRYPVVDSKGMLVGMVTSRDVATASEDDKIGSIMTPNPVFVTDTTTLSYAAHLMIWWNVEILPVTRGRQLIGLISREDVIKALHYTAKQPQISEAIQDTIFKDFDMEKIENGVKFKGKIPSMLVNQFSTVNNSALMMLMCESGIFAITQNKRYDAVLDNFSVYFIKPIGTEELIEVFARIIEVTNNFSKLEIRIMHEKEEIAKALMSVRLSKRIKMV